MSSCCPAAATCPFRDWILTALFREDCATVVAVPTLLVSKEQVERLSRARIRYLGNVDRISTFALLTDPPLSPTGVRRKR